MTEETKKENKKTTKPKKKKNDKIDKSSLIFFGIMIVGLIILTVILLTRPSSVIYSVNYGDDFVVHAEIFSNNSIDIAVDVNDDRVIQSGMIKEITDDDIEGNYEVLFNETDELGNTTETIVQMLIVDDTLTLTYDDGTEIILKESK